MKNILIYDIAAEKTGAAAVLEKYYDMYSNDKTVHSYFITSLLDFPGNDHTTIIKLPWIKKSYLHRLYCDNIYIHKLLKEYKIDEIINLQNIALKGIKIPQTLYLHNAIPISDIDFDIRKERSLWLFKHVISRMIIRNIKYADKIIVQANWIKEELCKKFQIEQSAVEVNRIESSFSGRKERIHTDHTVFFYPANMCSYKNHKCIVDACRFLNAEGVHDYEVIFTLNPDTDCKNTGILSDSKNLPIRFVGLLNKHQMEDYYRSSVLIFPSYLETVGLPLVEAKAFDCNIIAADLPYARESVGNYTHVRWFNHCDPKQLAVLMRQIINAQHLTNKQ